MRTEPLFISAIIACPERAKSGNTDVCGERHSFFLSTTESTETIPTATAPRITDAQLSSRKELLESIRNGKYKPSPVRRAEIPKDNGGVRKLQYSDKSSNRAFPVFPDGKTVDFSRRYQRNRGLLRGFPRGFPRAFSAGASLFHLLRKSPFQLRRRLRQPLSRWQTKK